MSNKQDLAEVTNQIYDTLMGNVGMSEFHTAFPTDLVSEQDCDSMNNIINFTLNGINYRISIEEVETFGNYGEDEDETI